MTARTESGLRDAGSHLRRPELYLALLIPATVFAFWKSYFALLGDLPEHLSTLFHLHSASMIAWILMLVAQAALARTGRLEPHRWVGRASYGLVPVLVFLMLATTHAALNRNPEGATPEFARLNVFAFGQLLAFVASWSLAIRHRRRVALHARFMISTALAIGTAIVFRVFVFWLPGFDDVERAATASGVVLGLVALLLIAADWRRGLRRSPYWVVTMVLGLTHLGYWSFARTSAWHAACRWFAGL